MIKTCITPFGTFSNATTTPYTHVAIAQSKTSGGLVAAWGLSAKEAMEAALETDEFHHVGVWPVDSDETRNYSDPSPVKENMEQNTTIFASFPNDQAAHDFIKSLAESQIEANLMKIVKIEVSGFPQGAKVATALSRFNGEIVK